jgi:hypothetical protein
MKAKKGRAVKNAEFGAICEWFDRLKKRLKLYNIIVQGEAATAESFPLGIAKIIDDRKLKFFVISQQAWPFWKSMIRILKEVRKSVLTF